MSACGTIQEAVGVYLQSTDDANPAFGPWKRDSCKKMMRALPSMVLTFIFLIRGIS